MPDWSQAIENYIANKPTPQKYPNPVEYEKAMAEYAEVLGKVMVKLQVRHTDLPVGFGLDSEQGLYKIRER